MRSAKRETRSAKRETRSAKRETRSANVKCGLAARLCSLSACNKNREKLSDGCPAFEELVSQNVSDLGLRNSSNKFNHSKSKPLRSELKFVSHILWEMWNWECGVRTAFRER
jgi:hypothetical protein